MGEKSVNTFYRDRFKCFATLNLFKTPVKSTLAYPTRMETYTKSTRADHSILFNFSKCTDFLLLFFKKKKRRKSWKLSPLFMNRRGKGGGSIKRRISSFLLSSPTFFFSHTHPFCRPKLLQFSYPINLPDIRG